MPKRSFNHPAIDRFNKLLTDITLIYEKARQELVGAYWNIGKLIVEIEQNGDVRAHYGDALLQHISDGLQGKFGMGFSVDNLERMRKFYLFYPKSATSRKLTWSHYVELISVDDKRKRYRLEGLVKTRKMAVRELRQKVREIENPVAEKVKIAPLKRPKDLRLNTCKKAKAEIEALFSKEKGNIIADCGFYVYRCVSKPDTRGIKFSDQPSYTYCATVERVVDGDTLKAVISLGFGASVREVLRLRGINAAETGTEEGGAAKTYLTKLLPPGTKIIIKSTKSDLHGRFVADVFAFSTSGVEEVYVNQDLLDKGFTERAAE